MTTNRIHLAAGVACSLAFLMLAQAAERQVLTGHVPAAVARLQSTERLSGSINLNLAIGLPLRNREGLNALLQQIYDPASPNYRHYLTPEQFTEQFGPTEKDYQALVAFATANGLTVTGTHPNRVVLDVRGTVTDIEKALHVTMRVYPHPTEARTFYAPDVEPSIDLGVSILHIGGLSNYGKPRPRIKPAPPANAQHALPRIGSGPGGGYMGNDFRTAYVPGSALTGAGQTVGLLQFDGYTASDIAYYENLAGLPSVTLSNVLLNGVSGLPSGSGGEGEVSLDIVTSISMAPGLSMVIVYEGAEWYDILNRMVTDNLAKQLSCSWYIPGGAADLVADGIFQQMAAQGQSFFNASGDDDAFTGLIDFPGDTPYITQVGGTTLTTASAGGAYSSETVWNWGGGTGSGGGISTYYAIPAWQQGINMAACHGSTTMRNVPDVALTADNVYVRVNGADNVFGGTSCAAPLWAGFTALMNQQNHGTPVGFLNPALYAIGRRADYTSCFHDTTAGNNYSPSSPTNFPAVAGYDLCTGWGTPIGGALINALTEPLQITPATAFLFSGPVGGPFGPAVQRYTLSNTGTNALNWQAVSPVSWLNASPMSGTVPAGSLAATVTVSMASAATSLAAGSYTANLAFTNLNDNAGQTRQVTLAVVTMPVITSQPTNQAVLEGANAAFSVATGSNALLFCQWRHSGTNLTDNGRFSGSATTNLMVTGVSPADVGAYSVAVSNAAGVAVSSNAFLTIIPSIPVFTLQPTGQTALPGQTVTLTVSNIGTHPFFYRWRANGTNLTDGANISGSAAATLTLGNVSAANAGTYSVVVSNSLGAAASSNAVLQVVSVTATGVTLAGLQSFSGSNGEYPYSPLAQGADGNFYGTTTGGGAGGYGTVFRMATNGALTTLVSFYSATNGATPYAGLLPGKDGNLYGTASEGGANGNGTVFRVTTNGVLTTLVTFNSTNGSFSVAGLLQTSDGSLYGTALEGGAYGMGTVFRMTTNGVLTTLVSFDGLRGSYPSSVLMQGTDGYLYGTTENGGANDDGTVFRMTTNGVLTTRASFTSDTGMNPMPGLVQDTDGSFYGTAQAGGAYGMGTVFKLTPAGALTNLYSFTDGGDGGYPFGGLLLGSDGNLYGTTTEGGTYGYGTVFRIAPNGSLATLANFDGYQGLQPLATLIQGANGNLYGTTRYGGAGYTGSAPGYGAVFKISMDGPPLITCQPLAQSTYVGASVTLSVAASGSQPLYYQWRNNGTNLTDSGNCSGSVARTLKLSNVTLANAGTYSVIVSNALGAAVSSNAVLAITSSGPIITRQPASQTALPGWTAAFTVEAVGNLPLFYQWRLNSANVTGATNATLTLTGVATNQTGNYSVAVSNAVGSAISSNAMLYVVADAATTVIKFDDLAGSGLAVPAGYCDLNWNNFYYLDGVNYIGGGNGYRAGVVSPSNVAYNAYGDPASISRAGSFNLLSACLTAAWTSNMQVRVLGYAGDTLSYDNTYTVSTNTPTLINFSYLDVSLVEFVSADHSQIVVDNVTVVTAPAAPQILSQPADQTVRVKGTATFGVTASGTAPLSYFWRRNGTPIPGANGTGYTASNVQPGDSGSTFSCLVSNAYGVAASREATLTVSTAPDYFTELFNSSANHVNDLSYHMLTFTPDGSPSCYSAYCNPADAFPSSAGGTALSLGDDSYAQLNLDSGAQVSFYGTNYASLFVGSNGYITFGHGDREYAGSLANHFNSPRISALFDDLNCSAGGTVTWTQLVDRVVVTFQNVPEYDTSNQNSFQYELFFNGEIRLTFLGIAAQDGLAGLSQGMGVPADFFESDLTSYGPAVTLPALRLAAPVSVWEGDGVLTNAGHVFLPAPAVSNAVVTLTSGNPSRLRVPQRVTLAAGSTNASFSIMVVDDQIANGSQPVTLTASSPDYQDAVASVTVLDNELHHFGIAAIPSPQSAGSAFAVAVTAYNLDGMPIPAYTNAVRLWATNSTGSVAVSPSNSAAFAAGTWSGWITVGVPSSNVRLCAGSGAAAPGVSNPFDVLASGVLLRYGLDTDPGWLRTGEWAYGVPQGRGGDELGYPDPLSGSVGASVFGVNLGGDYEITPGGPYYLKAGPFDFQAYTNVALHFTRWLNTDSMPYVDATVEMSGDGGAHWSVVWSNGEEQITDSSWLSVQYRLPTADRHSGVYVRWVYAVRDYAWSASGWNLGEVSFTGLAGGVTTAPLGTPLWWLAQYGLTNGTAAVEELRDADGDGFPAWQEYLAGTDPTNARSFFHVLDFSILSGSPTLRFYGTANSGVTAPFGMLRFTNMAAPGVLIDGSIPRNSTGTNVWADPSPPVGGRSFYRPVVTNIPSSP